MASALPAVVAFKLMLAAAQIANGTTYNVVDGNSDYSGDAVPCYVINPITELEFTHNPIKGSFMVMFIDNVAEGSSHQDNINSVCEVVYNTCKALKDLNLDSYYLVDATYTVTDQVEVDQETKEDTGTRYKFGYFTVNHGQEE